MPGKELSTIRDLIDAAKKKEVKKEVKEEVRVPDKSKLIAESLRSGEITPSEARAFRRMPAEEVIPILEQKKEEREERMKRFEAMRPKASRVPMTNSKSEKQKAELMAMLTAVNEKFQRLQRAKPEASQELAGMGFSKRQGDELRSMLANINERFRTLPGAEAMASEQQGVNLSLTLAAIDTRVQEMMNTRNGAMIPSSPKSKKHKITQGHERNSISRRSF